MDAATLLPMLLGAAVLLPLLSFAVIVLAGPNLGEHKKLLGQLLRQQSLAPQCCLTAACSFGLVPIGRQSLTTDMVITTGFMMITVVGMDRTMRMRQTPMRVHTPKVGRIATRIKSKAAMKTMRSRTATSMLRELALTRVSGMCLVSSARYGCRSATTLMP